MRVAVQANIEQHRGQCEATGPLRVLPENPRYFTDGHGKAIYLTGSHTWSNLVDLGQTDPPPVFNFEGYLDFIKRHNHNLIRLWRWELTKCQYQEGDALRYAEPFPWLRTGPGTALDGKPKFDLSKFDELYFDRLRSRVIAAKEKGIYVLIMLFEGYGMQAFPAPWCWDGHPFNINNNVNGVNGDVDGDGKGLETHTLRVPEITALQKAYVKKAVDVVNDMDNVLYEIANESHSGSDAWQNHMIDYIHSYEANKPKQHPVLYSSALGNGYPPLWASRAEAVSPGWPSTDAGSIPYRDDAPANDGRKVVVSDTDHLWGMGGNYGWVWKSFLRGLNPIFMDPYETEVHWNHPTNSEWGLIRKNMGYTLNYSRKIDLVGMVPRGDLCSTNYCLANPGKEYLIYVSSRHQRRFRWYCRLRLDRWLRWMAGLIGLHETVRVEMLTPSQMYRTEWFNPGTGEAIDGRIPSGGSTRFFTSPFAGDAVLYVYCP